MEKTGVEEESERVEGTEAKGKRRKESCEVHNVTSKSSMDEDRPGKGRHP